MPVIITEQSCLLKVSPPQLFISVIHLLWRLIFFFLLELLDSLLAIGSSEKFMEQSKSTKYKETRLPVNVRKGTFSRSKIMTGHIKVQHLVLTRGAQTDLRPYNVLLQNFCIAQEKSCTAVHQFAHL